MMPPPTSSTDGQHGQNGGYSAIEQRVTSRILQMDALKPSYPTRCLQFLQNSSHCASGPLRDEPTPAVKVKDPLNILISGAGLGGLATAIALARSGHSVKVFEQTSTLAEVGAGIQIPPNSSRVLLKWGLGSYLQSKVVEPSGISFRRWHDGSVIGYTRLVPDFRRDFGAPYYVVHRAHFHDAMYRLAKELGVEIILNAKVRCYNPELPSLTLENGTDYAADLIVAADGLKSLARKVVLGEQDMPPIKTAFAAYRATVDVEKIRADPDISWLLDNLGLNIWIGDMRHVMTYVISGGKAFNMVLSHPETSEPSTWKPETALADMKSHFSGWDARLTKLVNLIDSTLKWPLMTGPTLPQWIHPAGKMLILGDAAHAMLPYMSQGAAMATEDAAALASSLSHMTHREQLPSALKIFQAVRHPRATQMQEASLVNGMIWHFADGQEQRARDEAMRPETKGEGFKESPNQWSDPVTREWCYGYDSEEEVRRAWVWEMQGVGTG